MNKSIKEKLRVSDMINETATTIMKAMGHKYWR